MLSFLTRPLCCPICIGHAHTCTHMNADRSPSRPICHDLKVKRMIQKHRKGTLVNEPNTRNTIRPNQAELSRAGRLTHSPTLRVFPCSLWDCLPSVQLFFLWGDEMLSQQLQLCLHYAAHNGTRKIIYNLVGDLAARPSVRGC